MKYFNLSSGYKIPAIGLGTWKSSPEDVSKAVKHALSSGYQHLDCAAIYLNEKSIGDTLRECINNKIISREDLFVTSKLWNSYHLPEDVLPAIKQTLRDLQLDYLDLYLIHWPVAFKSSTGLATPEKSSNYLSLAEAPLIDTWQTMEALIRQGLVKNIGVSNFSKRQLQEILNNATIKPVVNQVECHPYLSQNDLFKFCQQQQIHLTAYSPLGSGDRPVNFKQANEPSLLNNEIIHNIANKYHATTAQIVLSWQLSRGISVIPKSSNPLRIEENLKSEQFQLNEADIEQINSLNLNYRYVDGKIWTAHGSPYKFEHFWD